MAKQKIYYKVISFSFNSQEEVIKFIELATKRIKVLQAYTRCKPNNVVEIILQGDPTEISVLIYELRRIAKAIKEMMRSGQPYNTYEIPILLEIANLKAAIPMDVVFKILELRGHKVQVKEDKLITSARFDEVLKTIEKVSELYAEMMDYDITPQAKRLIAIYSIVTGKSINDSIAELLNYGLVKKYSSTERELIVLAYDYETCVNKLKNVLKKSS